MTDSEGLATLGGLAATLVETEAEDDLDVMVAAVRSAGVENI